MDPLQAFFFAEILVQRNPTRAMGTVITAALALILEEWWVIDRCLLSSYDTCAPSSGLTSNDWIWTKTAKSSTGWLKSKEGTVSIQRLPCLITKFLRSQTSNSNCNCSDGSVISETESAEQYPVNQQRPNIFTKPLQIHRETKIGIKTEEWL